jgi:hypothetical protein
MAKGKNHDRKAQPGFGKTNGKAGVKTGEFTLKKVKGELRFTIPLSSSASTSPWI